MHQANSWFAHELGRCAMEGEIKRRVTREFPLRRHCEGSRIEEELWVKAYEAVLSPVKDRRQDRESPDGVGRALNLVKEIQSHG